MSEIWRAVCCRLSADSCPLTSAPMTQKANPVTLTSYGQVPLGLEGSGAFRRPGSIVRVLRTERWVRPTERAGSEGSFICRCLGQRKPDNRASPRGPPIGGQDHDGESYRCSAPYTLCLFEAFPSRGNEKIGGTGYCVTYDTDSQSRNVLASPLGEEGHEVAKGCTRVRMIMILDVDVTAERRHYNTHRP